MSVLICMFFIQGPPGKDGRDFSSLNLVKEFVNNSVTKGETTKNLALLYINECVFNITLIHVTISKPDQQSY